MCYRFVSRLTCYASLLMLALAGPFVARAQTLTIQNGVTVQMQNGSTLDLGTNTDLVEEESTGARLTGGTGTVTATRDLNAPSSQDVAGLGAVISSSQNLGTTTVTRGHAVQTDNGNESIERYYDIAPANNSGLGATLAFHYRDAELNGLAESELILFRSGDDGSTFTTAGHDSRDASANTVTLGGIDALSRWTLGSESQPLPVELAAFEARATGEGGARLSWKTLSEHGNDGFAVERKGGKDEWTEIGFVDGTGTTTEAQSYAFTDDDLPFEAQRLHYRLKQVDFNGTATFSQEVAVEVGAPQQFALHGSFPNPFRAQTTIRYELPTERHVTVAVYDALGRKVKALVDETQAGRQEIRFEAAGLASGVYFVRMRAGDYAASRKLVLVR